MRIAVAEIVAGHGPIDDRHARPPLSWKVKSRPASNGVPRVAKYLRRDPAFHDVADFSRLGLIAFHGDAAIRAGARDRRRGADGGRAHARNRFQSPQHFLIRERQLFIVISAARRDQVTSRTWSGGNPDRDAGDSTSGEQIDRQRSIAQPTKPPGPPPGSFQKAAGLGLAGTSRLPEGGCRGSPHGTQSGNQSGQQDGQQGDCGCEKQYVRIGPDMELERRARPSFRNDDSRQHSGAEIRHVNAEHAADRGKQQDSVNTWRARRK